MQETQNSSSPWANMAVGYRFCPTDEELVTYYLQGKNNGSLSSFENQLLVKYCDFYGKEEPWEIWKRFGGDKLSVHEDLFFFTTLKKVAPEGGSKINRRVGSSAGTWHCETSGNSSVIRYQNLTAYKKRFNYRNPSRLDQDRCWNMLEFSLDGGEHVLCQLKKSRKQSKKKKSQTVDDDFVEVLEPEKRSRVEQELPNNFQENQEAVDIVPSMEERDSMAAMRIPLPHYSYQVSVNIGESQVKGSEPDIHLRVEQELPKSFLESLQENQKAAVDIVYSIEEQNAMTGMLAMPVPLPDDGSYLDLINLGYYPNVAVEVFQPDEYLRVEEELPKNLNENQEDAAVMGEQESQKNFQENQEAAINTVPGMESQKNFQENQEAAVYMVPAVEEQESNFQGTQEVAVDMIPIPREEHDTQAMAASMPWPCHPEGSSILSNYIDLDDHIDPTYDFDNLFGGYRY
ncbi:conserved hypothetical protein [Ricinus communis]|uniref:NAC domain-containing protein n=1 Tax=Ricinus communis TaxID=3988 RepID=B9RVU0_RICCO|nr:conserved hypothetical protein [Ricinus communis]